MLRSVARALLRGTLLIGGLLLVTLAVLTIGARLLLPFAEGYRDEIEDRLSARFGQPVTIGTLDLRWRGRGPELRFTDVSLAASRAGADVAFDELLLDFDLLGSAVQRTPVVGQLTLIGAELSLRRSASGRWRLRSGADVSPDAVSEAAPDAATTSAASDSIDEFGWLFDARRVGLLGARLTLSDAATGASLRFGDLDVRVVNDGAFHRLRADLDLPGRLGGTIELGLDLHGSRERLKWSDIDVYASGSDLRAGALRDLGQLWLGEHGTGAAGDASIDADTSVDPVRTLIAASDRLDADVGIEFWGTWGDGALHHARTRLSLHDLRPGPSSDDASAPRSIPLASEPLLDRLSADLLYRTDDEAGWVVEGDGIELVAAGERVVIDAFRVERGALANNASAVGGAHDTDPSEVGWRVSAGGQRLPLSLFARVLRALPTLAPSSRAHALASLEPGGTLGDWDLRVEARDAAPRLWFSGDLRALSLGAVGSLPSVDSLNGRVRIADSRGRITLVGDSFTLARQSKALEVDALRMAFDVDARIPGQARLDGQVALRRASLEAELRAGLTLAAGRSPHVDVQGRYAIDDVTDVPPWLAIMPLPAGVNAWFARALIAGRAEGGTLEWVGRVGDFPYTASREGAARPGVFRSTFDLRDGELEFLPDWPRARAPLTRVEVDGVSVVARSTVPGALGTFDVRRSRVGIADVRQPVIDLETSGEGALPELIAFANDGPLAYLLRPVLASASGSGRAGMDITLRAPLSGRVPLTLDGSLFLAGSALTLALAELTFDDVRGAIGFDENGVRFSNLRARLFDRAVTLNGASSGEGERALTEVELTGLFEAADVLSHYGIPLDRFVNGASRWRVVLSAPHAAERLRRDGVRLFAQSDLVGMELLLPAPLTKRSASNVPLTVSSAFRDGATMTRWRLDHADRLRVAIDVDEEGLHALGARFGDGPVTPPEVGIRLDGQAPALSLDGWATALATLIEDLPVVEGESPEPILPVSGALSSAALRVDARSLGAVTLNLSSDANALNAEIDNAHLAGSVRWPREHWRRERVADMRIRHLDRTFVEALIAIGETDEDSTSGGASVTTAATARSDDALDPRLLPTIEARVSRFVWDDLVLRDVTVNALPVPLGMTFDLRTALGDGATLRGNGTWRVRDAGIVDASRAGLHASALALVLAGENLGNALDSVGLRDVLAESAGRVRAELAWRGPFYRPVFERASGSLTFDLERGRIVPFEPGAARLVGLFALQAIPRRLALDFRDVTSDGLAFESINGDISLAGGVAEVELVQMTGPIGVVDIIGTSDLVAREYDQEITVLPRVSAALPIIGLISGGATAGIGALVAAGVLKAFGIDFDRIGLRRYALRGGWDEPVLEPLGGQPNQTRR